MPSLNLALEAGGPKRLRLAWNGVWNDLTVHFDEQPVATVPGPKELKEGRCSRLPDGSDLTVQLAKNLTAQELRVLRDGQPVPGSSSDPARRVRDAAVW